MTAQTPTDPYTDDGMLTPLARARISDLMNDLADALDDLGLGRNWQLRDGDSNLWWSPEIDLKDAGASESGR